MEVIKFVIIGRFIISGIFCVAAGAVAYSGNDGWGYLIIGAIILGWFGVSEEDKNE